MRRNLLLTALLLTAVTWAYSQGTTTSAMNGTVLDSNGDPLPGASVVVVHKPTGTTYGTSSNNQGRFYFTNIKVGGPYQVTFSFIGYATLEYPEFSLSLGENKFLTVKMTEDIQTLQEIMVTGGKDDVFSSDRTGAQTFISKDRIATMPTITRGFNDFLRLTPQADIKGAAISIGGMNNRYNQVVIDGAVSNDVFGLSDTGTNGGSTGTSPISLDAIQEFQVVISPFDVRYGGFAGGGISAITRSGTNTFSGSVYHYFRNERLAGKTPTDDSSVKRKRFDDFTDRQSGFRIGGPIIKDKLFFFLNAEVTQNVTPLSFEPGSPTSNITLAEAQAISAIALGYGYNPGSYVKQESTNESQKIFFRLDYNISDKHKVTFRHSYTNGERVELERTPNSLIFSNGAILRKSKTNSSVLELNSRFSNTLTNNLIVGYTTVREPRTAPGDPFPRVTIVLGPSNRTARLGTEAFSTVNQLNQNILTITDNINLFVGQHSFTFGTHNEFYDIYNAFVGQAFGDYQFQASPGADINDNTGNPYTAIENWGRGLAYSGDYQYSKTSNPREGAFFRAAQIGLYIQDDYQMYENLKISAGIRLDIPMYLDNPLKNDDFNNSMLAKEYNVKTNQMPRPAYMWSPRIGFNWDALGDGSLQVRGGLGIFTSRFPFVWAGGAFTQSGVLLDRNRRTENSANPPSVEFFPNPYGQPKKDEPGPAGGNITVIDRNFKLPQVARFNVGVDKKLPWWGLVGTVEFMHSKNLNAFRFTNINLVQPTGTFPGADDRVVYPSVINDRKRLLQYTEVIYIDNVDAGTASNITFQIQKPMEKGFYGSVAYSYTRSTDLFPGTSSQNHSNYHRVASVNGSNNVTVGNSPFNIGSRITGAVSYRKEYFKRFATTVSLFYTGQSGVPFSYIVGGDLNRSTFSTSLNEHFSLVYIPKNQSEITFVQDGDRTPQQQWNDFNAFIEQDEYLKSRRGKYAERNGARTPFTHQFDLKIIQDIFVDIGKTKNSLQLTLDIFNVGNMLNKEWGWRYLYGNSYFDNNFRLLTLAGFDGVTGEPQYQFKTVPRNEPWTISDSPIGGSRWVAQIGIRYNFN
jgi:outer membrane receptor for ferrienterochelin and colicin